MEPGMAWPAHVLILLPDSGAHEMVHRSKQHLQQADGFWVQVVDSRQHSCNTTKKKKASGLLFQPEGQFGLSRVIGVEDFEMISASQMH